jgi:hypothetical protein
MVSDAPANIAVRRRRLSGAGSQPPELFPLGRRERSRLPIRRQTSRSRALVLVAGLTVLAAAVRLASGQGLSVDEIRTLAAVSGSFGTMFRALVLHGVQPPLFPALEWLAVHLLGSGQQAARLPALVAGVAMVPACAWLGRELFDRLTAIIAAGLACAAPLLVWYSQQVAGYELVALFGVLALTGAVRARRSGAVRDWLVFTLAASLAVWSDWSGIFIVVAGEGVLLFGAAHRLRPRQTADRWLAGWGISTLALACQLVPLGVLFARQLHLGGGLAGVTGVAASGVTFYSTVSNISWGLFGFHPSAVTTALSAIWPLVMLASLVLVGRGVSSRGALLLTGLLLPALGTLALGLAVPGAFDVRYAIASVPPLLVLVARATTAWPRSRTGTALFALGVTVVLGAALIDQELDRANPRRFDFSAALAGVRGEAPPGSLVLYEPANLRAVFTRDGGGLHAQPLSTHLPTRAATPDVFVITSQVNGSAAVQLIDRDIGALRATRHLVRFRSYPGVAVWWFR